MSVSRYCWHDRRIMVCRMMAVQRRRSNDSTHSQWLSTAFLSMFTPFSNRCANGAKRNHLMKAVEHKLCHKPNFPCCNILNKYFDSSSQRNENESHFFLLKNDIMLPLPLLATFPLPLTSLLLSFSASTFPNSLATPLKPHSQVKDKNDGRRNQNYG